MLVQDEDLQPVGEVMVLVTSGHCVTLLLPNGQAPGSIQCGHHAQSCSLELFEPFM